LGCPKNQVDGEEILGAIAKAYGDDCELVSDKRDAEVLIVNTCGFIDSAKEESVNAILDAVKLKKRGIVKKVVVSGCLAQRYVADLSKEIPEVDAFIGVESAESVAKAIFARASQATSLVAPAPDSYPLVPSSRMRAGAVWTAYLKVSDGCDHGCTFCSIPSFRGKHRSKPIERVVEEAKSLAESGAKELCVVAQDTTAYGLDLYKKLMLPELLDELCKIEQIRWIRLLYCYPTMVRDNLIETIARQPKVVPYIDIPLQHGEDAMLKSMNRAGVASSYTALTAKMRSAIKDLTLRTTFIVGFPGETDEQFETLKQFVKDNRFDRMGAFVYSKEENTPSANFSGEISREVANKRRNAIMAIQRTISLKAGRDWIGREIDILIESRTGNDAVGRSVRDAPEIDGAVIVKRCKAEPGSFIKAIVTDSSHYDLIARQL